MIAVNIILFLVWLVGGACFSGEILSKILPFKKSFNYALGLFLPIFLLGLIANIFTSWLKLDSLAIVISFLIVWLVLLVAWLMLKKIRRAKPENLEGIGFAKWPFWLTLIYLFLIGWGFYQLYLAVSGNSLASPWQVLGRWYLAVIFLVLLLAISVSYFKIKLGRALLLIIFASLLIHSYLLVYKNGFSGDRWRHLASENRIMAGMEYQPTLLSADRWQTNLGPLRIPRALIDPGKISYGQQWSLEIIASRVSGLNVFTVNKVLLPILWSIFLPLIMAALAIIIWPNRIFVLLSGASTLIFYLLQYYGSQGLPAGYGVLWWSYLLIFWLAYLKRGGKPLLAICGLLSVLMYFSYSLSFLLMLMSVALIFIMKLKSGLKYLGVAILSLVIVLIEWIMSGRQLAWNGWTGWWRAGNLIFFESGGYLNAAMAKGIILIIMILFFCLLIGLFLYKLLASKNKAAQFLAWSYVIIMINYALSWTFLGGGLNLARRLTVFAAIPLVLILAWGISHSFLAKRKSLLVVILLLSLLGVFAYRSGPVLSVTVSDNDLFVVDYLWSQIKDRPEDYCVIAPISVLLPLETISAKQITNGNLPYGKNYESNDQPRLMQEFIAGQGTEALRSSLLKTGSKKCFSVVAEAEARKISVDSLMQYTQLGPSYLVGQYFIWQLSK